MLNLTKQYIAAFASKDINVISNLMSENFVLKDPTIKQVFGKDAALEVIGDIFSSCEEIEFTAKNIYEDRNTTLIEFILMLDGSKIEGVDVIEWRYGLMSEMRAYLNLPVNLL